MDLIYLDSNRREQGVVKNAEFESEVGGYFDFTLKVPKSEYFRLAGNYVYPRGAVEFGGKITDCDINSDDGFVTFTGKTWLGMVGLGDLPSYYLSQNAQHSLQRYASDIISQANLSLGSFLVASTDYNMPQAAQMLEADGEPLNMLDVLLDLYNQAGRVVTYSPTYSNGRLFIIIGSRAPVVYSSLDYANNVIPVEVDKQLQPVTRIIYAMENEGAAPSEKRRYLQRDGTWSSSGALNDTYIGFEARTVTVFAESQEEFDNPDWTAIVDAVQLKDSAVIKASGTLPVDVGDIVTSRDDTTGITATETVRSKSLQLIDGVPIYSFETD